MTAGRLEFQENGLSIWITIPPKIGSDDNGVVRETGQCQIVSLDNLYSAAADCKQEAGKDLSSSKLPFLWKLYEMLDDVESSGQDDIVSWVDDGKAFKVHQLEAFITTVVPKYSKLSKYKSFQRQLYFYGFTRIQSGKHKGAYHHPKFVRGKKTLCLSMTPKNNSRRRSSSSSQSSLESAKQVQTELARIVSQDSCTGNSAGQTTMDCAKQVDIEPTPIGCSSAGWMATRQNLGGSVLTHDMDYIFDGMPFHFIQGV